MAMPSVLSLLTDARIRRRRTPRSPARSSHVDPALYADMARELGKHAVIDLIELFRHQSSRTRPASKTANKTSTASKPANKTMSTIHFKARTSIQSSRPQLWNWS